MRDGVTIFYRGAGHGLGRAPGCYGIWALGADGEPAGAEPVQRWPQTTEGWNAAWAVLHQIEPPGTVAPVTAQSVPVAGALAGSPPPGGPPGAAGPGARTWSLVAAAVTAAGVALGIAGLFPGYFGGSSLASQPEQLVPHLMYLVAWTAGGALVLLGDGRRRVGALLGLGTSLVTLGLFIADVGEAVAGPVNLAGGGLDLSLAGWLACAAGAALALVPRQAHARRPATPRQGQAVPLVTMVLAGVGAAITFAPSWDSFTLRTAAGTAQTITAGNAFANPGPVIAGDVLVMIAVVAAVVAAGLWRPLRHGAALLGGAIVPLVAQAASALIQVGQPASPGQFGIAPGQAAQLGLTISSGLTLAFWLYCAFVLALALSCAWLAGPPDPAGAGRGAAGVRGWPAGTDAVAAQGAPAQP